MPGLNLTNLAILIEIRGMLTQARAHLQHTVNTPMLQAYWHIGRIIVDHEQHGEKRAGYGVQLLKELSKYLKAGFGKGFDERNLRNMRVFYLAYPKWNTVRTELSWTHYRILLPVLGT